MLPIVDRSDSGIYLRLPESINMTIPLVDHILFPSPETVTFGEDHYKLSDNTTIITFDILYVRLLGDVVIVSPNGRPDVIIATDLLLGLWEDRQPNEMYLLTVGIETFEYLTTSIQYDRPLSWILEKLTVTFPLGTFELPHIVNIEPPVGYDNPNQNHLTDPTLSSLDPTLSLLFLPGTDTWYEIQPSEN